jgi:hypothetical protein
VKVYSGIERPDLVPSFVAMFYHWMVAGYRINVEPNGSYVLEKA